MSYIKQPLATELVPFADFICEFREDGIEVISELYSSFSDWFKDENGIRPRGFNWTVIEVWNWMQRTIEEQSTPEYKERIERREEYSFQLAIENSLMDIPSNHFTISTEIIDGMNMWVGRELTEKERKIISKAAILHNKKAASFNKPATFTLGELMIKSIK